MCPVELAAVHSFSAAFLTALVAGRSAELVAAVAAFVVVAAPVAAAAPASAAAFSIELVPKYSPAVASVRACLF